MPAALSTGNELGLGLAGLVFVLFALTCALLVSRYRPEFPGRAVWAFVAVTFVLFAGMLAAVERFGVEEQEEAHAAGGQIKVFESDFRVRLDSGRELAEGDHAFVVENNGVSDHNLVIEGQGIRKSTDTIEPGQSTSLEVDLRPGEYTFYCSIPGHREAGMESRVDVEGEE